MGKQCRKVGKSEGGRGSIPRTWVGKGVDLGPVTQDLSGSPSAIKAFGSQAGKAA